MIFYGIIGGVGLLFLILSYIVAEIGDLFGGLADHEVHVGGHEIGLGHDGEVSVGPPMLSVRSLAAFLTGFGVIGYIMTSLGWSPYWAALPGLGSGLVMFFASWGITAALWKQQASSNYSPVEMVGQYAEVITPIPAGGLGEVALTVRGSSARYAARSKDAKPVPSGARVKIVELLGTTAIVEKEV
jgi:membrane protein implicated in regulation of membrane protease activity